MEILLQIMKLVEKQFHQYEIGRVDTLNSTMSEPPVWQSNATLTIQDVQKRNSIQKQQKHE